jgi:hypothetical protein
MPIPRPSHSRPRAKSFSKVDVPTASNRLSDILIQEGVYLGGSSVGKGLKHAARYYLHRRVVPPDFYNLPGAVDLEPSADRAPLEDPFYIVDIGVLVSQVYQWRRYFPRVEPFCKLTLLFRWTSSAYNNVSGRSYLTNSLISLCPSLRHFIRRCQV